MNTLIKLTLLALLLTAGACTVETTTATTRPRPSPMMASQDVDISFQIFYDELSPYGTWVNYQDYGYAWVPDLDRGFTPYSTAGRWVYTEAGWTWFSNYSWGWAPFHYGRWAYDDSYGWLWMPQNEWGPAWVTWRRSEGYYGWAPMGPGISIELSFGGGYRVPSDRWTFVRDRDINRPDIDRVYIDRSTNITIINNSTVINNTYVDNSRNTKYVAGPGRDDVQRVVGTPIRPVSIREESRPGQALSNDQLQIYRPRVREGVTSDRRHAPAKVVDLKELKPASERRQGRQMRDDNDRSAPAVIAPPPANRDAGRQEQPVVVPPGRKTDDSPRERSAKPQDRLDRQPPPVVTPPAREDVAPPRERSTRPPDPQERKQQPIVAPPSRDVVTPPNERPLKQRDPQDREQKPPAVKPADKKKALDQAKPKPGKVLDAKGRLRDPQPPKGKKRKPDDPKP